jgi:hypothetical protein
MRAKLVSQINRYLSCKATLRDIETWLLQHLQSILEGGEVEVITLANQVDADLMELREGLIDLSTLATRFRTYAQSVEIPSL